MDLVIIKYNAGNIQSVLYALERIGVNALVTDDYEKIKSAGKVIFPGVGEASSAMRYLKEHKLDTLIKDLQQPVLGICLGMQLMCAYSEENDTTCLNIFDEHVRKFIPPTGGEQGGAVGGHSHAGEDAVERLKVPQIGWNNIFNLKTDLFKELPVNSYCYFVHGYYAALGEHTIATADYIQPYSAALHKGNFYGVQFHPEKSAKAGEQILKNFLNL
ncbi:imidazole glycerol phosphate synthase subunit HisH [Niastella populi]|uniref:Imidazole glycerol phosphate synthase subunit HisH n=1 Tax=Niastella populi TaxID=550983 RepID=A0A1V9G3F3_9BACT|nr:imidazole glycerol phosphate synthase subunit HisH [Niastella populi]OQP65110.1 imidazole glycerol phosphate synthase, glutamine amidotransferase subunit [Niastella populi]